MEGACDNVCACVCVCVVWCVQCSVLCVCVYRYSHMFTLELGNVGTGTHPLRWAAVVSKHYRKSLTWMTVFPLLTRLLSLTNIWLQLWTSCSRSDFDIRRYRQRVRCERLMVDLLASPLPTSSTTHWIPNTRSLTGLLKQPQRFKIRKEKRSLPSYL